MPTQTYIQLPTRLKGFIEPDTSSQFEGYLEPGTYRVLEHRKNFPDTDTDYTLIEAPVLGDGDTWICSRWKNSRYGNLFDKSYDDITHTDFGGQENVLPESELLKLLPEFYDFEYDLDRARYPYDIEGVRLPQAPPKSNNCCTFVEALVVKAWQNKFGEQFKWSNTRHGQMMILSADDYFSPVTALVESNIAVGVDDSDEVPHPWTVIQGWRQQWRSGHTFIIVAHHIETDRVLTLESNSSYRLNGVGFRMIGNIGNFNNPPENWWNRSELWTWERIKSTYRYRKQARLKVTDRSWSGLG